MMQTILAKLSLLLSGAFDALSAQILDTRWAFAYGGRTLLYIGIPLAILFSIVCYFRTTEGLTWRSRVALAGLRFASFLCLLTLAAGTVCVIDLAQPTRPRLLLVIDDSSSMSLAIGDTTRAQIVDAALRNGLSAHLHDSFDVQTERTSGLPSPSTQPVLGSQDLARSVIAQASRNTDVPLSHILVVSDGMQVQSGDLSRVAGEVPAPVSTLYLDDAPPRDVLLESISVPPFVYAHDRAMITAQVRSIQIEGDASLQLFHIVNGAERPITTAKVTLQKGGEPSVARLEWEAPDAGVQQYVLRANAATEEITNRNNSLAFHLDVRGEKIRVLYVEGEPSWEYRYAKQALESDPAVEFYGMVRMPENEWFFQGNTVRPDGKPTIKNVKNGFPESPDELNFFDVLILGDLERKFFEQADRFALMENFVRQQGGGLSTIGGLKVYGAGDYDGTDLARMIPFEVMREKKLQLINRFNPQLTTQGLMHPLMQMEFDPQQNEKAWATLPWVEGGNAIPAAKPGSTTLLVHPTLRSKYGPRPVAAAWQYGRGRVYSSALDGTWHWRLARTTDTDYHRRYWGLIARWLGGDPRTHKSIGSLTAEEPVTEVGRQQTFSILVRDPDGNAILDASAAFTIESPGAGMTTVFCGVDPATPGRYAASFTPAIAGEHKVKVAVTTRTEETTSPQQSYLAQESRAEFLQTQIDAKGMQKLATQAGGSSAPLSDWKSLALPKHPDTVRSRVIVASVWQAPGLLAILIACLCAEWLLRKRRGLA